MVSFLSVKKIVPLDAALFFDQLVPKLLARSAAFTGTLALDLAGEGGVKRTLDFLTGTWADGVASGADVTFGMTSKDFEAVLGGKAVFQDVLARSTIDTTTGASVLRDVARLLRPDDVAAKAGGGKELGGAGMVLSSRVLKAKDGRILKGTPRPRVVHAAAAPSTTVTGGARPMAATDPAGFAQQNLYAFLQRLADLAEAAVRAQGVDGDANLHVVGGDVSVGDGADEAAVVVDIDDDPKEDP